MSGVLEVKVKEVKIVVVYVLEEGIIGFIDVFLIRLVIVEKFEDKF